MRVTCKSMEEIWRIKEGVGRALEGKTDAEILAYYREREPAWSKSLPCFPGKGSKDHDVEKKDQP